VRAGNGKFWAVGIVRRDQAGDTAGSTEGSATGKGGGGAGCEVLVRSIDNLEATMPKWLVNLAAEKSVGRCPWPGRENLKNPLGVKSKKRVLLGVLSGVA